MPILGITDKERLPRLGKIKLGTVATNSKGQAYPRAADHFVCPLIIQEVQKYGPEPKTLDIEFPVDNLEMVADAWFKAHTKSRGLVCKGDGLTAGRIIDVRSKTAEDGTGVVTGPIPQSEVEHVEFVDGITCPGTQCVYYTGGIASDGLKIPKLCKALMSLQFLMPDVPGMGVWQIDTSSYHSMLNIMSSLKMMKHFFGTIARIPIKLHLEPKDVSPDGRKTTVYIMRLDSPVSIYSIRQHALQTFVGDIAPAMLLPAASEERDALLYTDDGVEDDEYIATDIIDAPTTRRQPVQPAASEPVTSDQSSQVAEEPPAKEPARARQGVQPRGRPAVMCVNHNVVYDRRTNTGKLYHNLEDVSDYPETTDGLYCSQEMGVVNRAGEMIGLLAVSEPSEVPVNETITDELSAEEMETAIDDLPLEASAANTFVHPGMAACLNCGEEFFIDDDTPDNMQCSNCGAQSQSPTTEEEPSVSSPVRTTLL